MIMLCLLTHKNGQVTRMTSVISSATYESEQRSMSTTLNDVSLKGKEIEQNISKQKSIKFLNKKKIKGLNNQFLYILFLCFIILKENYRNNSNNLHILQYGIPNT